MCDRSDDLYKMKIYIELNALNNFLRILLSGKSKNHKVSLDQQTDEHDY